MMKLSHKELKKLILQEIETTTRLVRRVPRRDREEEAAERDFFGVPLEPPKEILDSAVEKELLATTMKSDVKADIAYRALFVKKDPVAWKVYNRFKAEDKNIFGNEKEFVDEYWAGPEASVRGKELFKQAQATSAGRPMGATGGGKIIPGRKPSPQTSASLDKLRKMREDTSRKIPQGETLNKELINYASENRAMKRSKLLRIIREEVEVVLTNEEAVEIFDLDPAFLLDEIMIDEKKLTSKERKDMSGGDFIFPDGKHFPIPDESHGRNALARANQFSSPPKWYKGSLQSFVSRVHSAVKRKFPGIDTTEKSEKPGKG